MIRKNCVAVQSSVPDVNCCIVLSLQEILCNMSTYINRFKTARSREDGPARASLVIQADIKRQPVNIQKVNAPLTDEVGVRIVDQEFYQKVIVTYRSHNALQCPLLFCHCEDRYNWNFVRLI